MRATVMYGSGDVRVQTVPDAQLVQPTDAVVHVARADVGAGGRRSVWAEQAADRRGGEGQPASPQPGRQESGVLTRNHPSGRRRVGIYGQLSPTG
jgi:hypothetical protein